jgi:hypothetical protein
VYGQCLIDSEDLRAEVASVHAHHTGDAERRGTGPLVYVLSCLRGSHVEGEFRGGLSVRAAGL